MTENPYAVSYANEQERIDYFYERTHKKIPLSRTGNFYIKGDEDLADAVICLGEKNIFETHQCFASIRALLKMLNMTTVHRIGAEIQISWCLVLKGLCTREMIC